MQDRNITEGLDISSALSSGSYVKANISVRVSRSGMLIVPTSSGRPHTRNNGVRTRLPAFYARTTRLTSLKAQ